MGTSFQEAQIDETRQKVGDIHLRGKNWSFHFPIVTSIVISIVLTIILSLFSRK